jgi:hypothetical protein
MIELAGEVWLNMVLTYMEPLEKLLKISLQRPTDLNECRGYLETVVTTAARRLPLQPEPPDLTAAEPVPQQHKQGKAGIAPETLHAIRQERQRYPTLPLAAFAMHLLDTGLYRTAAGGPASTASLHKWLQRLDAAAAEVPA